MADLGVYSKRKVSTENTEFNQIAFVIDQFINKVNTCTLVQIVAIHASGDPTQIGTVDVLPFVQKIGNDGAPVSNTTIFDVPFMRISGGGNAIICDPQPGDIGFCVFAHSDISAVQKAKVETTIGSKRRFNLADAIYVGTCIPVTAPTRYVKISNDGIKIKAVEDIEISAPAIATDTALKINGIQVVGAQQPMILDPVGGGIIDVQARAAIILISQLLKAHGLEASV